MAHAQKPDFVFRRNGRVHLKRRQFSRLLAAEVCASAVVMLDTPRSEVVWEYWLPTPFASFPFTPSPPVRKPCAIRFQKQSTWPLAQHATVMHGTYQRLRDVWSSQSPLCTVHTRQYLTSDPARYRYARYIPQSNWLLIQTVNITHGT